MLPSTKLGVSEILNTLRTEVRAEQLATPAGQAFLAEHADTLQTFRMERTLTPSQQRLLDLLEDKRSKP